MAKHGANNSSDQSNRHRPLILTSPKQRQGSYFEKQALMFLQNQGLILIAQNWQQPKVGELDLVMLETGQAWSTVVFIEVRQRRRSSFGDAALSVTKAKQRKIIKTTKYFLQHYPEYANYDCRFDVIAYNIARSTASMDSVETADDTKPPYRPEWLVGAFIAKAW
ncbi:YraN family protein [Psychrobacter sp. CAL346-MNA-CIBAN-0220]|uniref:YraN family protein n=1 Tax=Psychrobacter sp. CAL346-MNA-CIBAN-0220 TaxID=3140457 RepID=UPI003317E682